MSPCAASYMVDSKREKMTSVGEEMILEIFYGFIQIRRGSDPLPWHLSTLWWPITVVYLTWSGIS